MSKNFPTKRIRYSYCKNASMWIFMRGLLNGTMWIVKEPYEHVNTSFILHYIDSTLVAQRSIYSCITCIYLIYNLAHHKKWQWICGHNVYSGDRVVKFCVSFYEISHYRKTWRNYFELCTCSYRLCLHHGSKNSSYCKLNSFCFILSSSERFVICSCDEFSYVW